MGRKERFPLEIVVPLAVWQSAQKLRMLRNERKRMLKTTNKESFGDKANSAKKRKVKKDGRSKKLLKSLKRPQISERGDGMSSNDEDKCQDVVWDRKMEQEMPDAWGSTLESHYRKISDSQIVQGLFRRLYQAPRRIKRLTKKKKQTNSLRINKKTKPKVPVKKKIPKKIP